MTDFTDDKTGPKWLRHVSPACWLAEYQATWLRGDLVVGVALAASCGLNHEDLLP